MFCTNGPTVSIRYQRNPDFDVPRLEHAPRLLDDPEPVFAHETQTTDNDIDDRRVIIVVIALVTAFSAR
jgi:hypothetical protein